MLKTKERKCETCGEPTSLRGWYYVTPANKKWSLNSGKKEYHWWCDRHFVSNMMNLWAFVCTKKCQNEVSRKLGLRLDPEDTYVYVRLEMVLTPAYEPKPGKSVPMKLVPPKCVHCGRAMKQVRDG